MNRHNIPLLGGIVGPLLYVVHDVVGVCTTPNFSFIENTVSDLTNSAARAYYPLGIWLLVASALMGICFGAGIIQQIPRKQNTRLFTVGVMLTAVGCLNLLAATLFPQDLMGTPFTPNGIVHLMIVSISAVAALVLLWLAAKSVGNDVHSIRFKWITFGVFSLLFLGGILTGVVISQGWPVLGIVERIPVYMFQAWTMYFAIRLIVMPAIRLNPLNY